MANRVVTIEIGYSATNICEMDYRSKNPKVYKYFSIPTPDGVYEDGFLSEDAQFIQDLKSALSFNKVKTKQAVCTISSSKIATREVQLPAVKANQVQAMVEANASDYFPINLSEYELGHLVLGNVKEADGANKLKVLVMACSKKLIEGYDKLCSAVGLHLISVDYSGNSVYQIMKNECIEDTEMVIRIGEKTSVATIISNHNMVMQRNVVYGYENAVYTMMNSSSFPQKTFNEAFEELKRITCIRLSINESTQIIEKDENEPEVSAKVMEAMKEITESLAPLIGNIARVLDLYNSKNTDKPIKKISIIDRGSEISGISKLFTNELGVKTVVCGNIRSISWNHSLGDGSSGQYALAIGAGFNPIGFVNEEKKVNDLKDVNYKNVSLLLGVFFALITAYFCMVGFLKLTDAKNSEKALKQQEKVYAPAEEIYNRHNYVKTFYDQVLEGYSDTYNDNDNMIDFLVHLEEVLPADSYLQKLQSDSQMATLTINVPDLDTAGEVIEKMRKFDCAFDVQVQSIREVEAEPDTSIDTDENTPSDDVDSSKEKKSKTEETKKTDKKDSEEGEESTEEEIVYRYEYDLMVLYYAAVENLPETNTTTSTSEAANPDAELEDLVN